MTEDQKQRLRAKMLRYCKRLAKKKPEYAKELEEHLDMIVDWYMKNKRDMKPTELRAILDTPPQRDIEEVELADRLDEGHE